MTDPTDPTQTPELPPEVFAELLAEALRATRNQPAASVTMELARLAYAAGAKAGAKGEYQRGADAELEVICEWLEKDPYGLLTPATRAAIAGILRSTRRPKPQSLKEQALKAFEELIRHGPTHADFTAIRRALESLPDPQ